MANAHSTLVNKIVQAIGKQAPNARAFKRIAGVLTAPSGATVNPSIKGQADIYGFIKTAHGAVHFEIECKVGRDRMRPEQFSWRKLCQDLNVPHVVAHAENIERCTEVANHVANWVAGIGSGKRSDDIIDW